MIGFFVFAVVATANGAGYRYGVSDQAFYIPVVARALEPAAFPRDAPLIDSQGGLMLGDEVLATVVRVTGLPLDVLFLAAYLLSLLLIWIALGSIGRRVYPSVWLTVALAAAFALRHQIPRTSANSFEPYFHPRMLAFGVGALAIAALLNRRSWLAIALVAVSGVVHVTTGLWFAVMIGVAIACLDRDLRRLVIGGAVAGLALLVWAGLAGPLRGSFVTMDAAWLTAVASKDSLFASDWPLWAWVANLALIVVAWGAYRRQRRPPEGRPKGRPVPGDGAHDSTRWVEADLPWPPELQRRRHVGQAVNALLWGATALVALFLVTLPLVVAKLALPVQLQISRVFWLVDFVALICLIGLARSTRAARTLAAVMVAFAIARGGYIMAVEHPERPLLSLHLPASEWEGAMRWIKTQPIDAHVLADPGHAWKYGTSVRVSAERDVFLEEVKDSAIAIYSRDVALRYLERTRAVGDFNQITAEGARNLATRYDLDYLVAEADVPLPVAYKNSRFKVYSLNATPRGTEP